MVLHPLVLEKLAITRHTFLATGVFMELRLWPMAVTHALGHSDQPPNGNVTQVRSIRVLLGGLIYSERDKPSLSLCTKN